jgi:hypothetical protein
MPVLTLVRLAGVCALLVAVGWVLTTNPFPAAWREVRCINVLFEPSRPYPEFLADLRAGRIRSLLYSPEHSRAYIQVDPSHRYTVRLPELDPEWQELFDAQGVQVVVLAEGSC